MNRRAAPALGLALLAAMGPTTSCRTPRKPIPRAADLGPAVEMVQQKQPIPASASSGQGLPMPMINEHEPDDDRDHAQPIDAGKGVRGSLASPTPGGAGKGDDDWYSYLVQGGAGPGDADRPQALEVVLTGDPGLDPALDLFDGDGKKLLSLDERGRGPKRFSGLVMKIGQTLYLRVRASTKAGGGTAGGMGYELGVRQSVAAIGSETEPNDTPEQATEAVGADLSGVLSSAKDEDWFLLTLGAAPGSPVAVGSILRVEATTPGVAPVLRLFLPGTPPKKILEVKAESGASEMRLRNVGLPARTIQVLLALRSGNWQRSAATTRYQLHVVVEPPLEGAEHEPNDDCAHANPIPLVQRGAAQEGGLAGFLWPGDVDCYEVPVGVVGGPASVTFQLDGSGDDRVGCGAELRHGESSESSSVAGARSGKTLTLHVQAGGWAQVRVVANARGCSDSAQRSGAPFFDAPYRLLARVEPERGAGPSP